MKLAWLLSVWKARICSSTTGPHMRLVHSSGVANDTTVGQVEAVELAAGGAVVGLLVGGHFQPAGREGAQRRAGLVLGQPHLGAGALDQRVGGAASPNAKRLRPAESRL